LPDGYEAIELSPLTPLGTVSSVAAVDPALVVHTVRAREVLSDSTNTLALLAAEQRHALPGRDRPEMDFCASHRLVRPQLPQHEMHTAHFRVFAMVSAGRDTGSFSFELKKLREHVEYYITLIRSFHAQVPVDVVLKEYAETGTDWDRWMHGIEGNLIHVMRHRISREDWSYYAPVQFNINVHSGEEILNVADGGVVDWTQKLLSDRKERLLISGFGTELFCRAFEIIRN
jgi:hypothetical protein